MMKRGRTKGLNGIIKRMGYKKQQLKRIGSYKAVVSV